VEHFVSQSGGGGWWWCINNMDGMLEVLREDDKKEMRQKSLEHSFLACPMWINNWCSTAARVLQLLQVPRCKCQYKMNRDSPYC
jgi:hypothetical protein